MISDYFESVEHVISTFLPFIKTHETKTKLYSKNKGYIGGEIIFIDNSRLVFTEVIDIEETNKSKYRYHFMDSNNQMVFRYDNSEHFPNIRTFPHHKHLKKNVVESTQPTLADILIEIYNLNFKAKGQTEN